MEKKNINRLTGILHMTNQAVTMSKKEPYCVAYLERDEVVIPVIVSKYYATRFDNKHVECIGVICIASHAVKRECNVLSYFMCLLVNECSDEVDAGYVRIEGVVSKLWDIELTKVNTAVRKFKLECPVELDRPAKRSAPCRCFSMMARRSLELNVGDSVSATGYVAGNKTALRVVVRDYTKIN